MTPSAPAEPIRVAQVVAASSGSSWFCAICTELACRGFDVCAIIDSGDGDLARRLDDLGIRHHRVPMILAPGLDRSRLLAYVLRLPLSVLRLARLLRRERVRVAHSHVFVANLVTRFACALARVRHVAGIAGPRHLEAPLTRALDRFTCGLDDHIASGCEYTQEFYREMGVPAARLSVVYYGSSPDVLDPARVDADAFRRECGIPAGAPTVGLVAHFYPPTRGAQTPAATRGVGLKGHDTFLAAARLVARRFPDARFVAVGHGSNALGERYRQSLIDACRTDGFIERVSFPGHRTDLARVLASFDVAVQCSLTEGLGGTIDGLMMERPMVATRVGGMPEAVRHEETGLLVPPGDPGALAGAIERLLANRDEARTFARAGRELMLRRFTLQRTGADLGALYRRLAGRTEGGC